VGRAVGKKKPPKKGGKSKKLKFVSRDPQKKKRRGLLRKEKG